MSEYTQELLAELEQLKAEKMLDLLTAERDQLRAENERLRKVTHVALPTNTMEQAFSAYHRRGFEAGVKQGQAENERLQMQLAACGVIALANTPESACEARKMHPDYMSASCSDVANAVDREMKLRTQLAEARELLEESSDMANGCEDMFLQQRIDAWLEANDK